jgi:sec-independent protein translocase protein TatA
MIGEILQPTHLMLILVVALLVLGPKRLPEVGRSLGRGLREFKDALSGDNRDRPQALSREADPDTHSPDKPAIPAKS